MKTPICPSAGGGPAGESAGNSYAATRPASDQRRDGLPVKPVTEAVLYALAEMRHGARARTWPISFRPARGLWVGP